MNKNYINTIKVFSILTFFVIVLSCNVFAADYDFWKVAGEWYEKGSTNTHLSSDVLSQITDIIEIGGTGIIAIVAVALGIKYMLGSVSGKAEVKEQLLTFLVACIFFFGWSNLRDILITTTGSQPVFDAQGAVTGEFSGGTQLFIFQGGGSIEGALSQIFAIVLFIAKIIAVIATMWIGVSYILSGAEGKAQLKQRGTMYIIGIILIFSTLNLLTFISNVISKTLVGV